MRCNRLVAGLAIAMATAACSDGSGPANGMSRALVLLTDAPFPYEIVRSVNVYVVSVAAATTADTASGAQWNTIAEPRRRYDLLSVQDGATIVMGEGDIPAAQYAAVRLVINVDSSSIVLNDGGRAGVDWQGTGEKVLYALVAQPLALYVPGTQMQVVIDFDVGLSFQQVPRPFPAPPQFLFTPWIRAVNDLATGTIVGTVRGANAPSDAMGPVSSATIEVHYGNRVADIPGVSYLVATGRTDAQGHFAIHYVPGGDYYMVVHPPADFDAGVAVPDLFTVTPGETTQLDVTLPAAGTGGGAGLYVSGPNIVARGDSAYFFATVFGSNGDSVAGADVAWASRSPAVGTITGSANAARFSALALGTTWVVATAQSLADSILVSVVQQDSTGGGNTAPVATVTLTPVSQTVSVGDSAGFWATLRDAQGNELNGRQVTWTGSDTTVAWFQFISGQSVMLRAKKKGTTTVTATSEGKSGTGTVIVQ